MAIGLGALGLLSTGLAAQAQAAQPAEPKAKQYCVSGHFKYQTPYGYDRYVSAGSYGSYDLTLRATSHYKSYRTRYQFCRSYYGNKWTIRAWNNRYVVPGYYDYVLRADGYWPGLRAQFYRTYSPGGGYKFQSVHHYNYWVRPTAYDYTLRLAQVGSYGAGTFKIEP